MRLSNKLLSELISNIAGEDTILLVNLIKDKSNVSEFKIAEKMKISVNEVRNKLYKLQSQNLVSFTRKKDKIKGWYIYYWSFNYKRAKELSESLRLKSLELLRNRLDRETKGNFFICKDECIRLEQEQAMEYGFKCPECGQLLEREDNSRKIEDIKKEIIELEAQEVEAAKQKKSSKPQIKKQKQIKLSKQKAKPFQKKQYSKKPFIKSKFIKQIPQKLAQKKEQIKPQSKPQPKTKQIQKPSEKKPQPEKKLTEKPVEKPDLTKIKSRVSQAKSSSLRNLLKTSIKKLYKN